MLKLECNVCKTVYEAAPSKVQTEYRTGRKFIRCPKDGAIAYQEGWNSVGVVEDNSEALEALQKELQEEKGKTAKVEAELQEQKAKTAKAEGDLSELLSVYNSAKSENERLKGELSTEKAKTASLESELSSAKDALEACEAQLGTEE